MAFHPHIASAASSTASRISGTLAVGQTLTSTRAGQWTRNGSPIGGETGATYVLVNADRMADIACNGSNVLSFTPEGCLQNEAILAAWRGPDATYAGVPSQLATWAAFIDREGVTPTLAPTGGSTTKPYAPRLTMSTGLTGPYGFASLQDDSPVTWSKGPYLEWVGSFGVGKPTEATLFFSGYPEVDIPTGYVERQEGPGFNARGGSSEPTLLMGYPGTGLDKIASYDDTAWQASTTTPQSRFISMVFDFRSNGDVGVYYRGQPVDVIVGGWNPGAWDFDNFFTFAAWHSGTAGMSAPFETHAFYIGVNDARLSAAAIGGLLDVSYQAAGYDIATDYYPNDEASCVEFLDLGGQFHLENSGDPTFENIRSWQGRDPLARVHTTTSEATSGVRGNSVANRLNGRPTVVFGGAAFYTCGTGAHLFDASKNYSGWFIIEPTTIDNTGPSGWLGHPLIAEANGVWAVNLMKDAANLYGYGVDARVVRLFNYDVGDKTVAINISLDTRVFVEYWRTAGSINIRACDLSGKRVATPVVAGAYGSPYGNAFVGKGYVGSSPFIGKIHRWAHFTGYDAAIMGRQRVFASREIGFDCT